MIIIKNIYFYFELNIALEKHILCMFKYLYKQKYTKLLFPKYGIKFNIPFSISHNLKILRKINIFKYPTDEFDLSNSMLYNNCT